MRNCMTVSNDGDDDDDDDADDMMMVTLRFMWVRRRLQGEGAHGAVCHRSALFRMSVFAPPPHTIRLAREIGCHFLIAVY